MAHFKQDFDQIKRTCLQNNALWEDPLYPAADESLFYSRKPSKPFVWKRPSELVPNPQLFVGGASRFDVAQGMLGNSWFIAAVAGLSLNESHLNRVVSPEQSFQRDYAGIFKFSFWQYGDWVDVCVDDRLPSYSGRLVFVHSAEVNEFWSALLEKAYAKLCGSYEGLKGGSPVEAMEDLTGGLSEQFKLKEDAGSLFKILNKAYVFNSQMACTIDARSKGTPTSLDSGLVTSLAYTITGLKQVNVRGAQVELVRIRCPWGNNTEWNGAWSDRSSEWRNLSNQEKQEMGLTISADGEFWMSFGDFKHHFDIVSVCHLDPDRMLESGSKTWVSNYSHSSWRRRVSAGGCRSFIDTFWTNPQIVINLEEEDEEGDGCTFIVALMQKNRRKQRSGNLTIGFSVYEYDGTSNGPLDINFFKYNQSKARSSNFVNHREISDRLKLPKGRYIIVPSTFEPNLDGDFLLRVYSLKQASQQALDEQTGPVPDHVRESTADDQTDPFRQTFEKLSGPDMEVDAWELQEILSSAMKQDLNGSVFSLESCKGMVAMNDRDYSGKLGFMEFKELWMEIKNWKNSFRKYDSDRSGTFDSYELRNALRSIGYTVSNRSLQVMVMYYADKTGRVTLDNFIASAVKLKHIFRKFSENTSGRDEAKFTQEDYLVSSLYY